MGGVHKKEKGEQTQSEWLKVFGSAVRHSADTS